MRPNWSFILALLIASSPEVGAQQRAGLEWRGGAAVPVGAFRAGLTPGGDLEPGTSVALQLVVPRGARGVFYAGFAQHRLRCAGTGCTGADDLVSTSWNVGARFHPVVRAWGPWIRLGGVFDRSEADFIEDGARVRRVSNLSVGGEVGAGFVVPVTPRMALSPGVRYTFLNARFPHAGPVRMRQVVADLGVVFGFL